MERYDVIIVGAGPAGSSCAGRLAEAGIRVLLLDRASFPRTKPCAGWLTPRVFDLLGITTRDYPHSLTTFSWLDVRIRGIPIPLFGRQYAIRRVEFDTWLLDRSSTSLTTHEVRTIEVVSDRFVVDGRYSSDYLVGAGGSWCPVYRRFFHQAFPRSTGTAIVALEEEFPTSCKDSRCRLRFFDDGLPGYSWYVPKAGGFCNVGIGGIRDSLRKRRQTIRDHWNNLTERLERSGLVEKRLWQPKGYVYHLIQGDLVSAFTGSETTEPNNDKRPFPRRLFLAGDALGLATQDMGEGIAPAIESGHRVAEAIISGTPVDFRGIPRYSLVPNRLKALRRREDLQFSHEDRG